LLLILGGGIMEIKTVKTTGTEKLGEQCIGFYNKTCRLSELEV